MLSAFGTKDEAHRPLKWRNPSKNGAFEKVKIIVDMKTKIYYLWRQT